MDQKRIFEATLLPEIERENLCRELLNEFGANKVETRKKELIHSCILPFGQHKHGDRSPSASLNYELLTYKCLGCGNGGGLIWFIASCRKTDSREAKKWLDKQTGGNGEVMDLSRLLAIIESIYSRQTDKFVMPVYNERILDPWLAIHPYLTEERHIPEDNIIRLKLGWDPEKDRIIFPHFVGTSLAGWQARSLPPEWKSTPGDPEPQKYKNSPDFPKETTLYNYDYFAKSPIIVESPMSVARHLHHLEIEATFGASVTERQLRQLAKHPKVILWFDNDNAGWKATKDVAEYLIPYTEVWVIDSNWDADAADMSDSLVESLVRERSIPYMVWRKPETLYCLDCHEAIPCDC